MGIELPALTVFARFHTSTGEHPLAGYMHLLTNVFIKTTWQPATSCRLRRLPPMTQL
jgi:hypothetical protein